MVLFIVFAFLSVSAHNGTRNYNECKSLDFKPSACWEAKQMNKGGKFLCSIQGKNSDKSDCK